MLPRSRGTLMGYKTTIITNRKCSAGKCAHNRANGATLWIAEDVAVAGPSCIRGVTDYMQQESLIAAAHPDEYFSVN